MNKMCTFRFIKSNSILFFFHPSYHIEVEETESLHFAIVSRQAIPNVAAGDYGIVHNGVVLQLKGTDTLSVCPVSVSKSLRNVGGISVLLPLLDVASSKQVSLQKNFIPSVLRAISCLLKGVHGVENSIELKRNNGYKMLSYLLLRVSESGLLGLDTIDRLFDIATSASEATTVYSTSSSSSSSLFCPMIVDATCLRTVIMNHAVPLRSTTSRQLNFFGFSFLGKFFFFFFFFFFFLRTIFSFSSHHHLYVYSSSTIFLLVH